MNRHRAVGYALWLALLAFAGPYVNYVNLLFNTTTRWAFLGILCFMLLENGQLFSMFRVRFGIILATYLLWCMGTTLWSEVPQLSFMKSIALATTTLSFIGGGRYFATYWNPGNPLNYLLPVVAVTLFASLYGPPDIVLRDSIALYQGLSGNPNELGSLISMSFPYAFYRLYLAWTQRKSLGQHLISLTLFTVLAYFLWLTASRASIICVIVMMATVLFAFRLRKTLVILATVGVMALGVVVAAPVIQSSISDRIVYKGDPSETGSIFYSRQQVWGESLDQALKGGLFGGGYGVTIGDTDFSGGLTAWNYGREKGNSQLAIWEETGLVGLTLYAFLLATIAKDLIFGFSFIRDDRTRTQVGLLSGLLLGLLAQSIFEGWWTAPGSAESAIFWTTSGVILGLRKRLVPERPELRYHPSIAAAARVFR